MEMINVKGLSEAINVEGLLVLLCFFCLVGFVIILSLRRRIKLFTIQLSQQFVQQNEQAIKVLHSLQHSHDLSDKFQQQLTLNQQQITQQHAAFKSSIEQQIAEFKLKLLRQHAEQGEKHSTVLYSHSEKLSKILMEHQTLFNQNQLKSIDQLIDHLNKTSQLTREEQSKSLRNSSEKMSLKINELTQSTDNR